MAFWRNDRSVRFVIFASLTTGVLAFECARSSFTSSFVYSRRTVLLFVFLTISVSQGERPSNTSTYSFHRAFRHAMRWTGVARPALSYPFLRFGNWGAEPCALLASPMRLLSWAARIERGDTPMQYGKTWKLPTGTISEVWNVEKGTVHKTITLILRFRFVPEEGQSVVEFDCAR